MRLAARPLRPLALSVAVATCGVALLYILLLPRLTATAIAIDSVGSPPAVTQLAIAAGSWWLAGSAGLAAGAAWLARTKAGVQQRLAARALLQLILLADAAMVSVMLIGFYAAIVAIPQGLG